MIDINKLPDKIGTYTRGEKSHFYRCGDCKGASINPEKGTIHLGGWKPIGFSAGVYKVESNEEIIQFLQDHPWPWEGLKEHPKRIPRIVSAQ